MSSSGWMMRTALALALMLCLGCAVRAQSRMDEDGWLSWLPEAELSWAVDDLGELAFPPDARLEARLCVVLGLGPILITGIVLLLMIPGQVLGGDTRLAATAGLIGAVAVSLLLPALASLLTMLALRDTNVGSDRLLATGAGLVLLASSFPMGVAVQRGWKLERATCGDVLPYLLAFPGAPLVFLLAMKIPVITVNPVTIGVLGLLEQGMVYRPVALFLGGLGGFLAVAGVLHLPFSLMGLLHAAPALFRSEPSR